MRASGRADPAAVSSPEQKNYAAIERLERVLEELRAGPPAASEPESIREIGLEIAIAVREVGAMLINVGWEQTYASNRAPGESPP
jgi:hypothetical protein